MYYTCLYILTHSVPSVVCTDQPAVNNTDLVITWSYVHTGGLKLTHMSVEYRNETSAVFMTLSSYMSGSGFVGTTSGHRVSTNENSVSLPLPFAGVEYFFRVTATNEEGLTTADCPSILLTTGIHMTWICILAGTFFGTYKLKNVSRYPYGP